MRCRPRTLRESPLVRRRKPGRSCNVKNSADSGKGLLRWWHAKISQSRLPSGHTVGSVLTKQRSCQQRRN